MTGSTNVWILGGYQSDFARNLSREGRDFADLTAEVVDSRWRRRRVDAADIGVVHVANAFGEMFAAQGHLGAMPASVHDGLWGTPATRHEAACASGSVATLAAIADLRSGAYPTRAGRRSSNWRRPCPATRPRSTSARRPGSATRAPTQSSCGRTCSRASPTSTTGATASTSAPAGDRATELRERAQQSQRADPGLDRARPGPPATTTRIRSSRAGCAGSTAARSPTAARASSWSPTTTCATTPACGRSAGSDGWGHRTVGLGLQQKLDRAADDPYVLPHVRRAVLDAFDRAARRARRPRRFEVHDCFTPSEYLAIDHIGLTGRAKLEGDRERRDRNRRPAADQPQRRPDRRRPSGRRVRRADARRRRQAGQRHRRRLSGRGRKDVRHA